MSHRPGGLAAHPFAAIAVTAAAAALLACSPASRAGGSPAAVAAASAPVVQRCGWFDNPSPGNATLVDAAGEWTVGQQGGHQAEGPWPRFPASRWVRTGTGSAGYGCACLRVRADDGTHEVASILSARARPLSACRFDPALKGKEPENPLK